MDEELVAVYALVPGVKGLDAMGNKITIEPGTVRWMLRPDAEAAELLGEVQLCAGLDTASLKPVSWERKPKPEPKQPTRRKYERRDVVART